MTGYASFGKQNLNLRQGIGYIADMEQRNFAAGSVSSARSRPEWKWVAN
ncbi:MAG: hypothetical protein IPI73_28125 [Betaproteobacteria bacterium]|nr:hypothetical protein [Betaproteobacteria bacterium]